MLITACDIADIQLQRLPSILRLLSEPVILQQLLSSRTISGIELHDLEDEVPVGRRNLARSDEAERFCGRSYLLEESDYRQRVLVGEIQVGIWERAETAINPGQNHQLVIRVIGLDAFVARVEDAVTTAIDKLEHLCRVGKRRQSMIMPRGYTHSGSKRPDVSLRSPWQTEHHLGAPGEAGTDDVTFLGYIGILMHYAPKVTKLNGGESVSKWKCIDEDAFQLDAYCLASC